MRCLKNLDAWNGGGWGYLEPQPPIQPLGRLSVDGRTGHCPERQPRHLTIRVLMVSTVGALNLRASDSPVLHRTCPIYCLVLLLALLLLFANYPPTVHVAGDRWSRLLRSPVVAPLDAPDSLVAHRTVR
jgi:hypothetical protein